MQKLEEADLYKGELILVSGKLVERYNKCLVKLGFTETNLTSFFIDGIGWSPEIAAEKEQPHYLNNGEANPHCIIITPLQKGLPVYNPFHSFDRELMKQVFIVHGKAIDNITRDSAICVDFDQRIDVFYEPLDVLRYKNVTVKFRLVDNLNEAKKEQLALLALFKEGNNFIDEAIHQKILASSKKYGDLRERKLSLHDLNYTITSFYTQAFGGIFVLKSFLSPILIFEDIEAYNEAIQDTSNDVLMYHISHPQLIEKLHSHLIIECDLGAEITKVRYERIKKFMLFEAIENPKHPIDEILEDELLFKSYLNKISIEDRKKVMSVDRYFEKKKTAPNTKINDIIDNEVYLAVHTPHSSLKANEQDLIWNLLVSLSCKDVLFLYWYDKKLFYEKYKTWDDSMKDWVIATIKKAIGN